MKINLIDTFAGIGGFTQGFKQAGFEIDKHYFSEVDKYASSVYRYHFPDAIELGDITKIKKEDIKYPIDIITGGVCCFAKGTLITTGRGLIPIEEVVIDDYVLTHKNRFKKVINTMTRITNELKSIKIQGSGLIQCTEEHPFYVRQMYRKYINKKVGMKRFLSDPNWKMACELVKNDFIGIAINKECKIPHFGNLPLDKGEFWYLVGR